MLNNLYVVRFTDDVKFKLTIGNNGDYLLDLEYLKSVFPDGDLTNEQLVNCVYVKDHVLVPDFLLRRFIQKAANAGDIRADEVLDVFFNVSVRSFFADLSNKQTDFRTEFEYVINRKRSIYYRNGLTDALELFKLMYADVIDEKGKPVISEWFVNNGFWYTTDLIYKAIYGVKSVGIRKYLGLKPKTNLRAVLSLDELKAIEEVEQLVSLAMLNGEKPKHSVSRLIAEGKIKQRDLTQVKLNAIEEVA